MKYKVLKDYLDIRDEEEKQLVKVGEIVEYDNSSATRIIHEVEALLKYGFIEEVKEEERWKPQIGESFMYIGLDGLVGVRKFDGSEQERAVIDFGNAYPVTSTQAVEDAKWLKAFMVLRDDTHRFSPDWEDEEQGKWCVYYDFEVGQFVVDCPLLWKEGPLCFASEREALSSIEMHTKEWEIYLGVVKNEGISK